MSMAGSRPLHAADETFRLLSCLVILRHRRRLWVFVRGDDESDRGRRDLLVTSWLFYLHVSSMFTVACCIAHWRERFYRTAFAAEFS
jgi:hypothetical protein